ncbi:MAG: hypothetical protein HFI78_02780 [Lachnospiraceae bacterium]|nr:hypothetical protein [Lachnospiraceae bacterium]
MKVKHTFLQHWEKDEDRDRSRKRKYEDLVCAIKKKREESAWGQKQSMRDNQ